MITRVEYNHCALEKARDKVLSERGFQPLKTLKFPNKNFHSNVDFVLERPQRILHLVEGANGSASGTTDVEELNDPLNPGYLGWNGNSFNSSTLRIP